MLGVRTSPVSLKNQLLWTYSFLFQCVNWRNCFFSEAWHPVDHSECAAGIIAAGAAAGAVVSCPVQVDEGLLLLELLAEHPDSTPSCGSAFL